MDTIPGMTLTGFDTVIFTNRPHAEVAIAFSGRTAAGWLASLVDVTGNRLIRHLRTGSDFRSAQTEIEELRHAFLSFYRDEAMGKHLDAEGYTSTASGEGPFALHVRRREGLKFRVAQLSEISAADARPGEIEPYPAWICSPALVEVTVVTPNDPDADSFSRRLVEDAIASCMGPTHTSA